DALSEVPGDIAAARVRPGVIEMFGASAPPVGYLECDGAAVSRATYADLFAAIGTVYGPGDGATTFNVPDLRGEFVRGWDDGRGIDAARVFGSAQDDALEAHTHSVPSNSDIGTGNGFVEDAEGTGTPRSVSTGSTGGSETRPRNVALLYIIKT
ncbi:MAG: phage tail protein, partial [Brevundimonas sp.]|nr:phage tail protein [Brevundimonas sp.]